MFCRRITFLSLHLASHHKVEEVLLAPGRHRGMCELVPSIQSRQCRPTETRCQLAMVLEPCVQLARLGLESLFSSGKQLMTSGHRRRSKTLSTGPRYSIRIGRIPSTTKKASGSRRTAMTLRSAVRMCLMPLRHRPVADATT